MGFTYRAIAFKYGYLSRRRDMKKARRDARTHEMVVLKQHKTTKYIKRLTSEMMARMSADKGCFARYISSKRQLADSLNSQLQAEKVHIARLQDTLRKLNDKRTNCSNYAAKARLEDDISQVNNRLSVANDRASEIISDLQEANSLIDKEGLIHKENQAELKLIYDLRQKSYIDEMYRCHKSLKEGK